jgi:hypothetical protein
VKIEANEHTVMVAVILALGLVFSATLISSAMVRSSEARPACDCPCEPGHGATGANYG